MSVYRVFSAGHSSCPSSIHTDLGGQGSSTCAPQARFSGNSSTLFFTTRKVTTGVLTTVCTACTKSVTFNLLLRTYKPVQTKRGHIYLHGARRQWAGGGCGHGGKANNRAPRLAEKRWLQSRAHMQRLVVQLLGMLLEDTELWARCARRE